MKRKCKGYIDPDTGKVAHAATCPRTMELTLHQKCRVRCCECNAELLRKRNDWQYRNGVKNRGIRIRDKKTRKYDRFDYAVMR